MQMNRPFRLIYHGPTDELLIQDESESVPEFCDVLAYGKTKKEIELEKIEWQKKFDEIEKLKIERIRLFNVWKNLIDDSFGMTGASIFQNPMLINQKKIDEWKSGVKIRHQMLNNKIKRIYSQSIEYLESVKK